MRKLLLACFLSAASALAAVPPVIYDVEANFQQTQELDDQDFVQGGGVVMRYRLKSMGRWYSLAGLGARWDARSSSTSTQALQVTASVVTSTTPDYFQITLDSGETGSAVTNWAYSFIVTDGGIDYAIGTGTLNIAESSWTGAASVLTNVTSKAYTDTQITGLSNSLSAEIIAATNGIGSDLTYLTATQAVLRASVTALTATQALVSATADANSSTGALHTASISANSVTGATHTAAISALTSTQVLVSATADANSATGALHTASISALTATQAVLTAGAASTLAIAQANSATGASHTVSIAANAAAIGATSNAYLAADAALSNSVAVLAEQNEFSTNQTINLSGLDLSGGFADDGLRVVSRLAGSTRPLTIANIDPTARTGDDVTLRFGAYKGAIGPAPTGPFLSLVDIVGGREGNFSSSDTSDSYFAIRTLENSTTNERLRIASDGDLGVGTSAPDAKLHVAGSAIVNSDGYRGGSISDANRWLGSNEVYSLSFALSDANTTLIGVTSNAYVAADAVVSAAYQAADTANSNSLTAAFTAADAVVSAEVVAATNPYPATLYNNGIADALHRHSELVASDGSPDPAVSVDAAGNVGVGTASPNNLLHIYGDDASRKGIIAENASTDGNAYAQLQTIVYGGAYTNEMSVRGNGKAYIGTVSDNDLALQRNNQLVLYIDSSENVGVGTGTTPTSKLDVNGVITGDGFTNSGTSYLAGNVGIGTASPDATLHVAGTFEVDDFVCEAEFADDYAMSVAGGSFEIMTNWSVNVQDAGYTATESNATVAVAGRYRAYMSASLDTGGNNEVVKCHLYTNGAAYSTASGNEVGWNHDSTASTDAFEVGFTKMLTLEAGTVVDWRIQTDSAATLNWRHSTVGLERR